MQRRVLAFAGALALTMALVGCGGTGDGVLPSTSSSSSFSDPTVLRSRAIVSEPADDGIDAAPAEKASRARARRGRSGRSERSERSPRHRKPGVISGTVTDMATHLPIRRAVVHAVPLFYPLPLAGGSDSGSGAATAAQGRASHPIQFGYRASTGENGGYRMRVPAGEYQVSVEARGYQGASASPVSVRPRKVTDVDFELVEQGLGTVSVTVEDSSQRPLACAGVTVFPQDVVFIQAGNLSSPAPDGGGGVRPGIVPPPFPQGKTDVNGKVKFESVPTGRAIVNAWRLGYGFGSAEIVVQKGQTTDVTIELPLQSATVQGAVTDADTGQPLAGVLVTAKVLFDRESPDVLLGAGARRQTTNDGCPPSEAELLGVTDENGRYDFLLPIYDVIAFERSAEANVARPIPPPILPRHVIIAYKRGYRVASQTIEAPKIGDVVTVNFQLTKAP